MTVAQKIKTRDMLAQLRMDWDFEDRNVVFTNGCFDILHRGHVEYLQEAKRFGDILIVGVNSDDSVTRLKGPARPLMPADDRAFIIASLFFVDYVSVFDEDTPYELIRSVQPDLLVKGGDYDINDIVGKDIVEARGGRVLTIPLTPNRSTTSFVDKVVALTRKGILK